MIKKLNQNDFKMKIIQDLGYEYPLKKSKQMRRIAIFECSKCKKTFETEVYYVKKSQQSTCKLCSNITHGKSESRLYKIWKGMKQRCLNKKSVAFNEYGKKGITIADNWLNFENFEKWALSNSYSDELSIDRVNNRGNYEPSNCRWTNQNTQSQNTRKIYKHNTSNYRGVNLRKDTGKWRAYLSINRKQITIGNFATSIEAAQARDLYIKKNNLKHTLNF